MQGFIQKNIWEGKRYPPIYGGALKEGASNKFEGFPQFG